MILSEWRFVLVVQAMTYNKRKKTVLNQVGHQPLHKNMALHTEGNVFRLMANNIFRLLYIYIVFYFTNIKTYFSKVGFKRLNNNNG